MTLLKPRFDYTPIKRTSVNGKRLYTTPGGHQVPSVTTVLSATVPEKKKKALQEWRNAVGPERAQAITTQAANRGSKMHTYLENYIKTAEFPERNNNPFSWASHAMAQTVITEGLSKVDEVWGVEVPLYFPQMYAGTTDGVGIHSGAESILDYKQSNKIKTEEQIEDYFLQLVAYANAHNEVHGTNIRKGVVLMCVKPKTDRDGIILLTEAQTEHKPQYFEFVVEGADFDKWTAKWWDRLEQYYLQV